MKKISDKLGLSEFSWKRQDFVDNGEEIPLLLEKDKEHTYGELITEKEILSWLLETNKVFRLINETDKPVFDRLYSEYIIDLEYLSRIGKIKKNQIPELKEILNFDLEGVI